MPVVDEKILLKLVKSICDRPAFDHPVENIRVIETHISYVLLTGAFAYKILKPVSLGFADFSALERRRAACYEEVRLNRRLAPKLYVGVVSIGGSIDAPVINEPGDAIEYAVKMRQFPDAAQLDVVIERDDLTDGMVRALAARVADFHAKVDVSQPSDRAQRSELRFSDIADNFEALDQLQDTRSRSSIIAKLREWSMESLVVNGDQLRRRKREGFVRECHGDMHLANMALFDDAGRKAALDDMDEFLRVATDCRRFAANPMLLITCGPSATGKSTIAAQLWDL